ncbi:MetQ/NlpA family ABC transporter substrate-binding protein [Bartonella sp. B10]
MPNNAVHAENVSANAFQQTPYLNNQIKKYGDKLSITGYRGHVGDNLGNITTHYDYQRYNISIMTIVIVFLIILNITIH